MYRLLQELGVGDIEFESWVPVITDFSFLRKAAMLDKWTDAMHEDGVVTEQAVDEW